MKPIKEIYEQFESNTTVSDRLDRCAWQGTVPAYPGRLSKAVATCQQSPAIVKAKHEFFYGFQIPPTMADRFLIISWVRMTHLI